MTITLIIAGITKQTDDIKSFILKAHDDSDLPVFEAGAHVNVAVELPDGTKSTRSYSIANNQLERRHYELGILRQGESGGSHHIHQYFKPGMEVEISQPVNNFRLAQGADLEHVLIAGGIGVTPMLSMARTLNAQGQRFEFHYFGRSAENLAFRDAVAQLPHSQVREYVGADKEQVATFLQSITQKPAPNRHLYVCGPLGMIQAVLDVAQASGWPSENVHYEQFSAGVLGLDNRAFKVELALSGKTLEVRADQTLLDALLEANVEAYFDCRSGICGSCLIPVSSGEVDHRDTFLSDAEKQENSLICSCVSRARNASLILDI